MICKVCQNIFRGDLQLHAGKGKDSYVSTDRIHHETKDSLLQSVGKHCQICAFIWRKISGTRALEAEQAEHRGWISTQYKFHDYDNERKLVFSTNVGTRSFYVGAIVLVPLEVLFDS